MCIRDSTDTNTTGDPDVSAIQDTDTNTTGDPDASAIQDTDTDTDPDPNATTGSGQRSPRHFAR